jgi:hypothetical protein
MSDTGASPNPSVVIPAGPPILDAAAWVGHACWAELRLHQMLTTWLAVETDLELSQAFWVIRSHRAQVAAWWNRRLPELREHPRDTFVRPSSPEVADRFDQLDQLVQADASLDRAAAAAGVLMALGRGYEERRAVAVGPADRPVAATLVQAVAITVPDYLALRVEPVVEPDPLP